MSGPSTSNAKEKNRIVKFIIEHKGQEIVIELSDNETVADLKRQIESRTNIPVCRQKIQGWRTTPRVDTCSLSTLNLALETRLRLSSLEVNQDGFMDE